MKQFTFVRAWHLGNLNNLIQLGNRVSCTSVCSTAAAVCRLERMRATEREERVRNRDRLSGKSLFASVNEVSCKNLCLIFLRVHLTQDRKIIQQSRFPYPHRPSRLSRSLTHGNEWCDLRCLLGIHLCWIISSAAMISSNTIEWNNRLLLFSWTITKFMVRNETQCCCVSVRNGYDLYALRLKIITFLYLVCSFYLRCKCTFSRFFNVQHERIDLLITAD